MNFAVTMLRFRIRAAVNDSSAAEKQWVACQPLYQDLSDFSNEARKCSRKEMIAAAGFDA